MVCAKTVTAIVSLVTLDWSARPRFLATKIATTTGCVHMANVSVIQDLRENLAKPLLRALQTAGTTVLVRMAFAIATLDTLEPTVR